jgi:hypothetical protein
MAILCRITAVWRLAINFNYNAKKNRDTPGFFNGLNFM